MSQYFPQPYPDEILHSVIARYQKHLGHESSILVSNLFGKTVKPRAVFELPHNIEYLLNRTQLHRDFTNEEFIQKHTLYPFYTAFAPEKSRVKIMESMIRGNSTKRWGLIGGLYKSVCEVEHLRFCPECMLEDVKEHGEPYWHRNHQVAGVVVCHKHQVSLLEHCQQCDEPIFAHVNKYVSLDCKCAHGHDLTKQKVSIEGHNTKLLLSYAESVAEILNGEKFDSDELSSQYLTALKSAGDVSLEGYVGRKVIIRKFMNFYSEEFLTKMNSSLIDVDNWLVDLLKRHALAHPFRELLFIIFMFGSLAGLRNRKNEFEPFGKGPWLCLNPTADHYKMPMINDCVLKRGRYHPVIGIFKCECGFTYTRKPPESGDSNQYKKSKVLQFGWLWEQTVRNLFDQGLSPHQISKQVSTDIRQVKRCINEQSNDVLAENKNHKKLMHRNQICLVKKDCTTRNEIWDKARSACKWLSRYDKEWFEGNMPPPVRFLAERNRNRTFWTERDKKLAILAKEIIEKELVTNEKPQRISISYIRRALGIKRHITASAMPVTRSIIEQSLETGEAYRRRRIKWAVKYLREIGCAVTKREVFRLAQVQHCQANSKILHAVQKEY